MLSSSELVRYSRQLLLPEVGPDRQARLKASRVAIVGLGGLGSPAALYLAAAGVGTLILVDFDHVELANLHRQILHGTGRLGHTKVESARERLADLNPEIRLEAVGDRLTFDLARDLFANSDLVIDGTDNFPARYAIAEASTGANKPYVYGSIARFEGQVAVFGATGGPCYRCLFPEPPPAGLVPNCAEAGVLGVLPGVIGTLQAVEAIKLLLGIGQPLIGRLLSYDALAASFREWRIARQPDCPGCREENRTAAGVPTTCAPGEDDFDISPVALARLADAQVVDVREPWEWAIGHLQRALHVPLGSLAENLHRLDRGRTVVTVCHKGARSRTACEILRAAGFSAQSLQGGLDAWATQIEPTMPRY